VATPAKVAVPFPERNLPPAMKFMYTPPFQRAIALDDQLTEYEELVKAHFKLDELKAVGDPSPAQVTVVGRIVCEAAEGKLNPSVVQIEGSRKTCGGQRVMLDLSGVKDFQIFPGKVRSCCSMWHWANPHRLTHYPHADCGAGGNLSRYPVADGSEAIPGGTLYELQRLNGSVLTLLSVSAG
jgi:hypothetical protein